MLYIIFCKVVNTDEIEDSSQRDEIHETSRREGIHNTSRREEIHNTSRREEIHNTSRRDEEGAENRPSPTRKSQKDADVLSISSEDENQEPCQAVAHLFSMKKSSTVEFGDDNHTRAKQITETFSFRDCESYKSCGYEEQSTGKREIRLYCYRALAYVIMIAF